MSKVSKINKEKLDWVIEQPIDVQLGLLNPNYAIGFSNA